MDNTKKHINQSAVVITYKSSDDNSEHENLFVANGSDNGASHFSEFVKSMLNLGIYIKFIKSVPAPWASACDVMLN